MEGLGSTQDCRQSLHTGSDNVVIGLLRGEGELAFEIIGDDVGIVVTGISEDRVERFGEGGGLESDGSRSRGPVSADRVGRGGPVSRQVVASVIVAPGGIEIEEGGGNEGGRILFSGSPEDILNTKSSPTAPYLEKVLQN